MIAVLIALLMVSVLATGFFMQSRDSGSMAYVTMAQMVAANNAELGLAEGIRRIRSSEVDPGLVSTCTIASVEANACATYESGYVSGPATADVSNGGGLQYRFLVFQLPPSGDPNLVDNRYMIRATGYYGMDLNAPGLVTSILESEVDMGRRTNKTECRGSYECI